LPHLEYPVQYNTASKQKRTVAWSLVWRISPSGNAGQGHPHFWIFLPGYSTSVGRILPLQNQLWKTLHCTMWMDPKQKHT